MSTKSLKLIGTAIETARAFGVRTDFIPADIQTAPVYVNTRLRTALGMAKVNALRGRWVEINPRVYADREQMRETLAHEIAHLIAGIRAGHSVHWQTIARALGATGERCVTADAAQRIGIVRAGRVVGRCGRCGFEVRRRKALRKDARYSHRGCGGLFERVDV